MEEKTEKKHDFVQIAQEVFQIEADALNEVASALDENFSNAVEMIASIKGRVVVTGMGKSGHIGAKIAATLASTGTPSFFVHPAEMGHGDLGMLKEEDIVLALSFSGNTEELRKVLAPIKKLGIGLIAITGNDNSVLAEYSDAVLHTPVSKEACPLDLAPTSSTTTALVIGDALAIALMKLKNFQKKDFAKSHPLGSLGRSFVLVSELMNADKIPQVSNSADFQQVLNEINSKNLGFTVVNNEQGKLIGVITDGDLRRAQIKFASEVFAKQAKDIMTINPKVIRPDDLATRAAELMKEYRISNLVVVDSEDKALGTVDLKDLLMQGFVI